MSTSSSVKEASEALRHVEESEKKLKAPMLDRTRVWITCLQNIVYFSPVQGFLTNKKYSYCIVGPEDVEAANFLLYDTYHPDEPITKHLGLTQVNITSSSITPSSITPTTFYNGGI